MCKEGRRYCKGFSPAARNDNTNSFQERHGLNSCHLEALTATDIFAGDHVILTHHVGARLSELGAVALVRAWRQLTFVRAHQPRQLVISGLPAVRTNEIV